MNIDPRWTVAEILSRHPEAKPALARLGLDACCGGRHPLEFACRAHNVPLASALEAIANAAAEAPPSDSSEGISLQSSVRDILARHPAALPVFERHGLMGCGGAQGPAEPLDWFARVHHVDPAQLMIELESAIASPGEAPRTAPPPGSGVRENLYAWFLKAAMLFTFSGGTALGAWALAKMALRGQLGGLERGIIQVHGHFQLFGWVGLFVVGIAYHILPRLTGVPFPSYRAASASFVLLVAGTLLRTAQALDPSVVRSTLLLGGGAMELAGCGIFFWIVTRILSRQPGRLQAYQNYLVLGTAWLGISVVLNLSHAYYLVVRRTFEVPPYLNIPYLTVFLVGFVGFWILGVSLRTLPVFMGLRTRPALAAALPLPATLAVALLAVGEGMLLAGGGSTARLLFGIGGLGLAAILALYTWSLGILGPAGEREPGVDRRYEKFMRLGYVWLLISGAMLAIFSLLALAGRDMDHAFVGAYRHALTVGFITTIMVGMASRIVPIFRGVELYSKRFLEATFWLLAVGNLIRVLFQSLSGWFGPPMLRIAGVSGILELAGLLLFGINLWKTLNREATGEPDRKGVPAVAAGTRVGDLLAAYPGLLPVFVNQGFSALSNPVLRRTVARQVSVGEACRMHGVDLDRFLEKLAEAKSRLGSQP
jgi:uncharacterized protein involved in response to NO